MSIKSRKAVVISLLFAALGCSKQENENEGIPTSLDKLETPKEVQGAYFPTDAVWDKTLGLLEIPDIDRTSTNKNFIASLGSPSALITDATKAATAIGTATANVAETISGQKCNLAALTDITAAVAAGVKAAYSVDITTGGFKLGSDGAPTNLGKGDLTTKIYLMSYRLGSDAADRYALFSVPQTSPTADVGAVKPDGDGTEYGYPLAVYAHAGTDVTYGEVAKIFGDLQLNHIILAPAFPGENLCVAPESGKLTCNSPDAGKTFTSTGTSTPFVTDVTDLQGAYECVKSKLVAGLSGGGFTSGSGGATIAITSYAKISQKLYATGVAANNASLYGPAVQPLSYMFGFGRGANVATLALNRMGIVNSILSSTKTDTDTVNAQTAVNTGAGITTPQAFSCSMLVGGNYTYAHGRNKLYFERWVKGTSGIISDTAAAQLDAIPGFASIRTTIEAKKAEGADETAKATLIANYIKSIDTAFNTTMIHAAVANWGKVYQTKYLAAVAEATNDVTKAALAKTTLAAAQGAGLILNGTSDKVADVSNSMVLSGIAGTVTATIAKEKANADSTSALKALGGVNWLALGVEKPSDAAADTGHISDLSFQTGKVVSKTITGMTSVADETDYIGKTPSEVIATWLKSSCIGEAIVADSK
jgi:hypothetical protein